MVLKSCSNRRCLKFNFIPNIVFVVRVDKRSHEWLLSISLDIMIEIERTNGSGRMEADIRSIL